MDSSLGKFGMVILGMLFAAGAISIPYLKSLDTVQNKVEVKIGDQIIIAEVADTESARARGLQGRRELELNSGMLFLFERPDRYSFWMKNVRFPIDIVWINERSVIVGITERVEPELGVPDEDLRLYYAPVPVNRVLELKAGRARLLKAGIGSEIRITPLVGR